MAKAITAAMDTHIQQSVTTLATIWEITRRDGQVFRFTDHDQDLTYTGNVYAAQDGYEASQILSKDNMNVDNLDASGLINDEAGFTLLSDSSITRQDLRDGKYDGADVIIRVVNWQDTSATFDALIMKTGTIGEVVIKQRDTYQAEIRGITQKLTTQTGEVYGQQCRANLFDDRCSNIVALDGPVRATFVKETRAETVTSDKEFIIPLNSDTGFSFGSTNGEGDGIKFLQNGAFTIADNLTPDGSAARPFEIATPADLQAIPNSSSNNYVLTTNIDMVAAGLFTPILTYSETFDGRGFEIQNIDLDHNASPRDAAVFGSISTGAVIKRVGVTGATVRSGSSLNFAAALVADAVFNAVVTIQDCWATGGTVITDSNRAGGIIGGLSNNGIATRCWSANVISGVVGSLVGGCIGDSDGTSNVGNMHDSDVATTTSVGVSDSVALITREMKARRNFSAGGYAFDTTWSQPVQGYTNSESVTFNAAGKTLTRTSGSWSADGHAIGDSIWVTGGVSNNDTVHLIATVTALVLTVDAADTIVDEGPVAGIQVFGTDAYPLIMDPGRF